MRFKSAYFFITIMCVSIFFDAVQIESVKFQLLLNSGVQFLNPIRKYSCKMNVTCAAFCAHIPDCIVASFYNGSMECGLYSIESPAIEKTGFEHYLKLGNVIGTNRSVMTGARAWQSTTFDNGRFFPASLAIDGNRATDWNQFSCATTNNYFSYWAMEFGTVGFVTSVDIYLRSDHVLRNTNREVLISQTEDDVNNRIGTVCGGYYGPPISTMPYIMTITCPYPMYGRFLRISHDMEDIMEICEVIVYNLN